ncbi:MAG TPA: DUF1592 domain-containing protein [Pirellulales bacterium]|nr:DUF1592 domain-containing protein [Pirellulales bacterium]
MISLFCWKANPTTAVRRLWSRRPLRQSDGRVLSACACFALAVVWSGTARAAGLGDAAPLVKELCTECHGGMSPEAHLDLERLRGEPEFATQFRTWEKVIERLKDERMPPPDAPQPTAAQREELIEAVSRGLHTYIDENAGDPGEIVLRQLTSAELAYSIEDLTGVDLVDPGDFVSDAVGGAGFTNAGDAQFIHDATLERYLESAKKVAAHAVIGSGPLKFDIDPGKTGRELSSIRRIQEIYRSHGFRTAAGEGGKPFGLDVYPKSLLVAWQFRHRQALGRPDATLDDLARENGLEPRFAAYINSVLTAPTHAFPLSEIVAGWRNLPEPGAASVQAVREDCNELYGRLRYWQHLLASESSDEEEAAVLTDGAVKLTKESSFKATLDWREGADRATIELSVLPVAKAQSNPLVVWHNPRMRFRRDRKWTPYEPLRTVLSGDVVGKLSFGRHPAGAKLETDDFVLGRTEDMVLPFSVPAGATSGQLVVDVMLDVKHGEEGVVRCTVSDGINPGETVAATGTYSVLLADPEGSTYRWLKPGIEEFARALPEVSHREPAPSDRDPIPAPFDGTYNSAERNHFHAKIKYHRDDRFLVDHLLDDATRLRLDQAWVDLLTAFDYHDEFYRVVARKYDLPDDRRGADLDGAWIASLPDEPRLYVERLHSDYARARQALSAAEPGHVDQALEFAERAWRRPLSAAERGRLRGFYSRLRNDRMEHEEALRLLLARILVAPAFLYRAEAPSPSPAAAMLSEWEIANRLSYFLWSSIPDEPLRRTAAAGQLQEPETLASQARRMLRDLRARRFATEFFGQWFGFYRFDKHRGVDGARFPEFTDSLKQSMYDEAISFFSYVVREDRPVDEILFADYTFADAQLTRHYGLPAVESIKPVKIEGTGKLHRGGLLRLGAVLTVTSAPLRTSPVKRGDWVLRRILGTPVPPPPADAGSIAADDVQSDGRTLRARLEAHRRDASCVNCHSRMDPLGFALEEYDPIGRWRERYRDDQSIDNSGVLNDGVEISGVSGLLDYLKTRRAQFHQTFATRLLGYALGRAELASDRPLLDELAGELDRGGKLSDLVVRIASSRQFHFRRGGNPTPEGELPVAGEEP